MTKITRLVMHGFKSFARRTELVFGDNFNCILGPNGSGKCIDYNSLVQLADGSRIRIGDLVEEKLKSNDYYETDDGFVIEGDSTEILSMDAKTLKIAKRKISKFVKRTSPEFMLKIKTRSGREITATEYHPLFVLENDKIKSIKAEELQEGIKVAVPRILNTETKAKTFAELLDLITAEDGVYVPYDEKYREIILSVKKKSTLKLLADEIGIPKAALKGLFDKQSINFHFLVKILRFAKLDDDKIIILIPKFKSKTASRCYNIPWENSPEFARFFGYLMAEGRIPPDSDQIWFVNGTEEIASDYVNLVKKLFGISPLIGEYKENAYDIIFYSRPLQVILNKLGMGTGTANKEISNLFLQHSSNRELCAFLDGLYSGDGHVSKNSIELTTKSFKLAEGVETILLRLGILFNTKVKIKVATNTGFSGVYKTINITDNHSVKIFADNVRFTHPKKEKRLGEISNKEINPNLDLIDANYLVKKVSKELKLNVKKLKKTFPRIDSYVYSQCTPSRFGLQLLISGLFERSALACKSMHLPALKLLAESDVYWDEVVEIEKIKSQNQYVYDLTIENYHNFIANNFIVHNSNVLDALCFVLGRSSAKSLRAEKSTNLIYNGGKLKKPSKDAEVSIYFDNEKKLFPFETPEVKVSRIVKSSGQSVYKLNDKTRTRQQVLEMLALGKIDPQGYNIILQGDIIRFCEMSPLDRRGLIDEISGISIYDEKKNKAVNELNHVEEKLREADIVLKERDSRLRELKKDRDQALKYKDITEKLNKNKASLLNVQIKRKNSKKEEFDKKTASLQEKLDKLNSEITSIKKLISDKKDEISGINSEIESKGDKEQSKVHKEVESLKVELATSLSRKEAYETEIGKTDERIKNLKLNIDDMEVKIKKLEESRKEIQKSVSIDQKSIADIDRKISDFRKKHSLDNLGDIEREVERIDRETEEKQKEVLGLRQEQQELLRKKDRLEFQVQSIDEKISKVLSVEKEHKEQLEILAKKQKEFKKITLELSELLNRDSSLAAQYSEARKKLSNAEEELAKLNARNISIQETVAGDVATRKIMGSAIKGVHGSVSDLGEVSSKYSLALEIAAGNKIKGIVVEDDKVAAQCIKYLKENKFGVASFFPLNQIRPKQVRPEVDALKSGPGVHGLAIGLVRFDSRFKNVFSYVFGDTLVVDDIETARKIGIGKAKMVTLEGDLAEMSGAMRGGYRGRRSAGIGFREKDVLEGVAKYEKIVADSRTVLSALEKKRKDSEKEIEKIRNLKASLEGEIIRMEKSLHLESGDLNINNNLKQQIAKEIKDVEKELEALQSKADSENEHLAKLKTGKQELREKINSLRNPVVVAELNAFEEKKKELSMEILELNSEAKGIDSQKTTILKPEKENITRIIRQLEKEQEGFRAKLKELAEKIKADEKTLKEKEKIETEFYGRFRGLFSKRQKMDEQLKKLEKSSEEQASSLRNIELKHNEVSLERTRIMTEMESLEREFEQFRGIELFSHKPEDELRKEIRESELFMAKIGNINMRALEVYDAVEKEFRELVEKKENLRKEKEDVLVMMNEIETKKKELFMQTFDVINGNFKNIFSALSTKGESNLLLENKDHPFEGGVLVKVRITGNKFLDIRSLSGGEKTLTALAFIFSIQEHEPAHFYVLDEVDAALDKRNSDKFAKLVRKYSENAQYIVISHNDSIISEADYLYGVSMVEDGVSKVVSLKFDESGSQIPAQSAGQ